MWRLLPTVLYLALFGCSQQQSDSPAINAEFQYMADAARITLCDTGESFPVAMEQAYIELERAYLGSGVAAGSPAGVRVTGSIQLRPAMEGDQPVRTYIIEHYHSLYPGRLCP